MKEELDGLVSAIVRKSEGMVGIGLQVRESLKRLGASESVAQLCGESESALGEVERKVVELGKVMSGQYDGEGRLSGYLLRTYTESVSEGARSGFEGSIVSQGKVYERSLENGSRYGRAVGEFVIARMSASALGKLGNLSGQIAQELGMGGNARVLVYNETNVKTGELRK